MHLRVAVTGASGFIGQHVASALEARGDLARGVKHPFDSSTLAATFRDVHAVVHLAGVVSSVNLDDYLTANVEGTRIVAEAARDAGVRLIHVSSLAAAGTAPPSRPRGEDDPPEPITMYGHSKLLGELVVRSTKRLRWTILRPGVVYGYGDRALRPLFRFARRGILPLVGNPDAAYTFIYVDDAVRAILAAVDRGADSATVFLGHDRPVTARALIENIREAAGSSARIVPVPRALLRAASWMGDAAGGLTGRPVAINSRRFTELYSQGFVCRVDRMRDVLGVVAQTDFRRGLQLCRDWYVR